MRNPNLIHIYIILTKRKKETVQEVLISKKKKALMVI